MDKELMEALYAILRKMDEFIQRQDCIIYKLDCMEKRMVELEKTAKEGK
jgi:hypothetical protein